MRHAKQRHRLGRFTSLRKATLEAIARSLIKYECIKTTKTKAKAARSLCERLITYAKTGLLAKRRLAFSVLRDETLVKKLFDKIAGRYKGINGGYTRIIPFRSRRGDGAELVIFELTKKELKEKIKKEKKEPLKKETPKGESKQEPHSAPPEEKHHKPKEEPKKEQKGFLRGIRGIFKKERDSL